MTLSLGLRAWLFMSSLPLVPEVLYRGKFLEMVKTGHWEYVRRKGCFPAVGVMAITPDRELILVEQYRIPLQAKTIELPAGLVGDEPRYGQEELLTAARRELLEETGYQAQNWEYLFGGPSSAGLTDEMVHLFLATGLQKVAAGGGDAHESITIHTVPLAGLTAFLEQRLQEGDNIDMKVRMAGYLMR